MKQPTSAFLSDQIRAAIITGDYAQGMQLKQDDIASQFGVSKIPIREALVQLESQGFVDNFPGRGTFVSKLSLDDATELYLLRLACEPVLLEHSIKKADPMIFAQAEGFLNALSVDNLETVQWHGFDREFHTMLYSGADLPRMKQMIISTHDNLARYFGVFEKLGNDFHTTSDKEHRDLLKFSRSGDVEAAKSTLVHHLRRSLAYLTEGLEQDV